MTENTRIKEGTKEKTDLLDGARVRRTRLRIVDGDGVVIKGMPVALDGVEEVRGVLITLIAGCKN
jgi:regulator of extracellular matrix RemA (YlzA/DUF370 family)